MSYKFQVGDIVKICTEEAMWDSIHCDEFIEDEMEELCGTVCTITGRDSDMFGITYKIDSDYGDYWWYEEWLELADFCEVKE